MKTQQIEKRRREKNEFEKQKKEQGVLSELKRLKRMGLLNYIANKRKEKMKIKMNLMKKQRKLNLKKRKKKTSVLDLINE